MGCCNTTIEDEARAPLLQQPSIQSSPSTAAVYNDHTSTPPTTSAVIVAPKDSRSSMMISTFAPLVSGGNNGSTTTFSLITENEQKMLDTIVQNTANSFIDISQLDQELFSYGSQERSNSYRERLTRDVFKPSKNIDDIYNITNDQVLFKSRKFKLLSCDGEAKLATESVKKLGNSLENMKVADFGPIFVSFDL